MSELSLVSPKTIAQAEMRNINRSAVLEYLRLVKTASRTEMAEALNISLPSIVRIIDQLIASGLVRATGQKVLGRGRGRDLLELNVNENLAIGIDLGGSHISGALVNLGGRMLQEFQDSIIGGSGEENYNKLADFLRRILGKTQKQIPRILGIAIGVPGILESRTGTVKLAPGLEWNEFPLQQRLQEITELPVILENDVNLACLGEHWFGAGKGVRDLVMIAIGTGIGAGIILDGKLHRGHSEASGEIGYILPGIQFLNNQYPGFGALESVASGKGIAEQAAKIWFAYYGSVMSPKMEASDVFQAAQEGQAWAVQVVAETVDYLSLAMANVIVCLDPELVILGGGVAGSAGMLIEPIKKRLTGVIPRLPRIEGSLLNDKAAILGAVVRVFQKYTDYSVVHNG
ncbi:MAG: ROK family transcriptional regulator [Chloroflexota bacterium]